MKRADRPTFTHYSWTGDDRHRLQRQRKKREGNRDKGKKDQLTSARRQEWKVGKGQQAPNYAHPLKEKLNTWEMSRSCKQRSVCYICSAKVAVPHASFPSKHNTDVWEEISASVTACNDSKAFARLFVVIEVKDRSGALYRWSAGHSNYLITSTNQLLSRLLGGAKLCLWDTGGLNF